MPHLAHPRFTPYPGSRPRSTACRPHDRRRYAVCFDKQQRIWRSTRLSPGNRTYPDSIRQNVHREAGARRRVSRVLSRPRASPPGDGDGHSSGTLVTERLVRPTRAAARRLARHTGSLRGACRSYLVLLPVGFSLPPPLPAARCALTAPFHPCRPPGMPEGPAVYFLWHCPWGRPRRGLPGTVPPWSPDFPLPALGGERPSGRLACEDLGSHGPSVKAPAEAFIIGF